MKMEWVMVKTDIGDIPGRFTGHMERAAGPADAERLIIKVEVMFGHKDTGYTYKWVAPERCHELDFRAIGHRRGFGTSADTLTPVASALFPFKVEG